MANIKTYLNNIKTAVFGSEVRDSIHDAIQQCYDDASAKDNANMEVKMARGEYENLGKRLDSHSSQIKEKASKQEVEVERKRIDSFTSLTEGSTTGDAELIDGRIGQDGITYTNIGEAIRTQIKDTNCSIDLLETGEFNWKNGYRHLTTGDFVSQESYKCTEKIIKANNLDVILDKSGVFQNSVNSFFSLWKNGVYVGYYFTYTKEYYDTTKNKVDNIDFDSFYMCIWNTNGDYLTLRKNKNINQLYDELYNLKQKETNRWYGKKSGFLGDSITYGAYTPVGTQGMNPTERAEKRYCEIAGDILNMTVNNYGISGTTISDWDGQHSGAFVHRYKSMSDDLDLICVLGGCNDHLLNVPLGTIDDTQDGTFYGALYSLCYGLIEKYPSKRIVFITPIHRNREAEGSNSVNCTLEDYRKAIRDVARGLFGLKIIEGIELGINAITTTYREQYIVDGTHPNPILHELMGENLANELKNI